MKIALNATMFRPGQIGGMETYFRNLSSSLQRIDSENQYSLLCDSRYINELAVSNPKFSTKAVNFTKPSLGWLIRGIVRNTTKIDILRPVMNRLESGCHPSSIFNS